MPKRYNTPHRSRVVKTRLSEEEYADFTARLAPYGISQSEFLRQAIFSEKKLQLIEAIKQGNYQVQPILGIEIPKGNGKDRKSTRLNSSHRT